MEDRSKLKNTDVSKHPWILVSLHQKHYKIQAFDDKSKSCWYSKSIPEANYKVVPSSFGCLILQDVDSSRDHFLLDPESRQKFHLPPMEDEYHICLLSSRRSDPECCVLFIDRFEMVFTFYYLNDLKVHRQEMKDVLGEDSSEEICFSTLYRGQIYCVTYCGRRLFRVDLIGSCLRLTQVTESMHINLHGDLYGFHHINLVESGGELLLIDRVRGLSPTGDVHDFEVCKLDIEEKKWVPVNGIGDNAIFFSNTTTCSMSTANPKSQAERNSIYYFLPYDINLYVFDLEDGSITRYFPCPDADPEETYLNWFMFPAAACCNESNNS